MSPHFVKMRLHAVFLLTFLAGSICSAADPLPADIKAALRSAKRVMLYSLDPQSRSEGTGFHGFRQIGFTAIENTETRERIATTLEEHVHAGADGALCFVPRRGMRLISGHTIHDLVICYECGHIEIYSPGIPRRRVGVAGDTKYFDEILTAANIRIVPSRH